jgi:hypothetical protein
MAAGLVLIREATDLRRAYPSQSDDRGHATEDRHAHQTQSTTGFFLHRLLL